MEVKKIHKVEWLDSGQFDDICPYCFRPINISETYQDSSSLFKQFCNCELCGKKIDVSSESNELLFDAILEANKDILYRLKHNLTDLDAYTENLRNTLKTE